EPLPVPPGPRAAARRARALGRFGPDLLMAAAVIAVAIAIGMARRPTPAPAARSDRVAVALFENRTGDPALDRLSLITADWVARGVARNARIDVFDIAGLYLRDRTRTGEPTAPLV